MSRSRIVRPETTTLPISDGDWLLVKKRLNNGEQRQRLARLYRYAPDGTTQIDPLQIGLSTILAYLLDWSLVDPNGAQIAIAGKGVDDITAALDAIDPESFREIREAIEAHAEAMEAERETQKKILNSAPGSLATFPSPVAATGGTNG